VQTPLEQQVADLQQQVQQLMTLVKGKQEAVTPRERADFLAAQTALAERVTLAESKVNKSLDLAQRALDAANSALNTLPQCVSVELATSLQTQINSTVTGINDLNGRFADVKTQLDARPPTDNPAAMPVDVEDLAMLRSALDDRIDDGARKTEDIRSTLNARIDTEAARIAQLTKSVDDLERKSASVPQLHGPTVVGCRRNKLPHRGSAFIGQHRQRDREQRVRPCQHGQPDS
jgi:hypothetical protein